MMHISDKDLLSILFKTEKCLIGNDKFISLLKSVHPIKVYQFNSGEKVLDWIIPKKWIVERATLKDLEDNIILDYNTDKMNLMTYSNSYSGILKLGELQNHLYSKKDLPNDIPWVHSYYSNNWGFCIQDNIRKKLKDSEYKVDIKTNFIDSKLNIAELKIPGRIDKEIILSAYTCHPNQANDNVSGIYLLLKLYNILKDRDLKYTYRFLFHPETIGSITLIHNKIIEPEKIEYSLIGTCLAKGDNITYKRTFRNNHSLDVIVESLLSPDDDVRDYWPTGGSDERQFSSPNVRIPTGTIMGKPYGEFKEYHTTADMLCSLSIKKINGMVNFHKKVILEYEKYNKYILNIKGGEPFLTKYNLYREIGGTHDNYTKEKIRNWILFLCDGNHTIKDISKKSKYTEEAVKRVLDTLLKAKVIREAR
jgi:aminopeptidase-like protein